MAVKLFDEMITALSSALALREQRHQVIASNIANVETPGYRAREVDFAGALREAFDASDETQTTARSAPIVDDMSAPAREDGNTVDLDIQMEKLSDNADEYNALAKFLGHEFAELRMAIDETK